MKLAIALFPMLAFCPSPHFVPVEDLPLTSAQVRLLALDAGFSALESIAVVRIAWRESRNHPRLAYHTPRESSYCLMQINMIGDLGAYRLAQFGLERPEQLFHPPTCMRAAYLLYRESGWEPWTTEGKAN